MSPRSCRSQSETSTRESRMRREVMRRSRGSPGRQAPGHCSALLRVGRRRRPPDTGGKLLPGRRVAIVRSPTAGGPSPLLGGAGRRPLRAKSREPSPGDDLWLGQAQLKHFTSAAIVMGRHVPSSPDLSTMVRFDAVWVYLFFALRFGAWDGWCWLHLG